VEDRPRLELPQRVVAERPASRARFMLMAVGVLVLFGVVIALQLRHPPGPVQVGSAAKGWSAEEQKALAMRLEDRNLHAAAAAAWSQYLKMADPEPAAAAAIHYRIGKLHQSAEQYESAIAAFYQAEAMLGPTKNELGHEINVRVRDCFIKLGQYDDLGRDLLERTAPSADKPASLAGQQIVAEIGPEKITVADFDRLMQQEIDLAIKGLPGLSTEQIDQVRKHLLEQVRSPQARARKLQELVAIKVLARKARAEAMDKTPEFRKRLAEVSDMLLADRLLTDEISKRATTTIDDCKRYYEANKALYVQPASAVIAHIVCRTSDEAADLIRKATTGATFEDLAREHSLDPTTKSKGGRIDTPVPASGAFVPGIGENAELHAAIFKANPGTVLDKPYKGDGGYHVVKVVERRSSRQLTLDEASERVRADTQRARTQEVAEQYIQSLFEQAKVKLYPEAFTASATVPAVTTQRDKPKGNR